MDKILTEYLCFKYGYDYVHIESYETDGAICLVVFHIHQDCDYEEYANINIWNMVAFLSTKYFV